jgi:hypothetical protein
MSYDNNNRRWVRLSDALTAVMSAGLTESDAKQLICNGIADLAMQFSSAFESTQRVLPRPTGSAFPELTWKSRRTFNLRISTLKIRDR